MATGSRVPVVNQRACTATLLSAHFPPRRQRPPAWGRVEALARPRPKARPARGRPWPVDAGGQRVWFPWLISQSKINIPTRSADMTRLSYRESLLCCQPGTSDSQREPGRQRPGSAVLADWCMTRPVPRHLVVVCASRTQTSPARPYRGPGPAIPCRICQGTDYFAQTCPTIRPPAPSRQTPARLAQTTSTADILPPPPPAPVPAANLAEHVPPAPQDHNYDDVWHVPILPVSTVYAAPEAVISTAIADIGTPGDIVGDTWLRRHPQAATSPLRPATTSYARGHDFAPSIGRLSLRLTTTDTSGLPLTFDLPDVHILRHTAVPLLLGLQSHKLLNLIVDAAADTILFGRARRPVRCAIQRGHLTLPPSPAQPPPTSILFTRDELALAHRQFVHASVDSLLRSFPPTTFFPSIVANLPEVATSCVPCQRFSHLPRRPRDALPPRPLTFNRVIALDTFQIRPDLLKVLDVTFLHTDFGLGRFVSSMTGHTMLAVFFVTWLYIWSCPDTTLTDRGSEVENDPFVNALTSMGVHWRPIPTEAPWGIGRNERHHGPIRQAYLRIAAETPALAPDLTLAMAHKARNDAPRAHGSCPTTAVTGAPPSLLIGDNHNIDPAIASRHRAMQAARASMEAYTADDRLRGALSHPCTNVPFVEVDQAVWFHRDKHGWTSGRVPSLDGKNVYVTRNNRIYSSHEARTKPHVSRRPQPPPTPAASPVSDATLPIRTHATAPPPPTTLPTRTRAFLADPHDPDSPSHPRWDAEKRTELNIFNFIDCKTTLPAFNVPAGKQIFHYLWRVTHKPNRGNGKPAERARFCVAGNRDWHEANTVATSPVTPQRSIRSFVAASVILRFSIDTEDFLRAYLQSDILPEPTYVWAPPEAGEPDGSVWAFHHAMYGKNDAGRHFHFNTQSRFLSIPHITLSSAFDTVYVAPLRVAVCTYVDDTLHAGTPAFRAAVSSILKNYNTHRPDHDNVTFARILARTTATGIHCDTGTYAATISPLPLRSPLSTPLPNTKYLHSLAAKLLWVGRVARPDVPTDTTQLADLPDPTGADARRANAALASLCTRPVSPPFTRLDVDSLCLDVYADYSV